LVVLASIAVALYRRVQAGFATDCENRAPKVHWNEKELVVAAIKNHFPASRRIYDGLSAAPAKVSAENPAHDGGEQETYAKGPLACRPSGIESQIEDQ
jgi:hypothetical protein